MREMNAKKWLAVALKHIQEETDGQTNIAVDQEHALTNVIHTYIHHFQVLPAGLFSNLFTTNARFRG